MDWDTFVTTLMATGFASGAFVFLAKILSKHLLSMDLVRFKAELRANNEKELERLKADLRIATFQQETTFAKLHEKRAEIIAELYAKLVAVHTATKLLVSPIELDGGAGRQQRNKEAMDAAREFSRTTPLIRSILKNRFVSCFGDSIATFSRPGACTVKALRLAKMG